MFCYTTAELSTLAVLGTDTGNVFEGGWQSN